MKKSFLLLLLRKITKIITTSLLHLRIPNKRTILLLVTALKTLINPRKNKTTTSIKTMKAPSIIMNVNISMKTFPVKLLISLRAKKTKWTLMDTAKVLIVLSWRRRSKLLSALFNIARRHSSNKRSNKSKQINNKLPRSAFPSKLKACNQLNSTSTPSMSNLNLLNNSRLTPNLANNPVIITTITSLSPSLLRTTIPRTTNNNPRIISLTKTWWKITMDIPLPLTILNPLLFNKVLTNTLKTILSLPQLLKAITSILLPTIAVTHLSPTECNNNRWLLEMVLPSVSAAWTTLWSMTVKEIWVMLTPTYPVTMLEISSMPLMNSKTTKCSTKNSLTWTNSYLPNNSIPLDTLTNKDETLFEEIYYFYYFLS